MKNATITILILMAAVVAQAQIPAGYYNGTENLNGTALKQALHNIIDNHSSASYSALWTHVQTTDKTSNNKVWDVYSDTPGSTPPYTFNFGSDQCGNYSQEGDCYNREHSWPQSWFNSGSPMKTDLFHVYPTDGYVNGQRGSYPFGEVGTAQWTSQNGSKRGACTYPGYTSICFEPIDEYKGDFARSYFYMSTRYYGEDSGWATNSAVDGAEIKPWSQNLFMEWHVNDPVSTKEINRNNAIYGIQNNRNPFIDHPEFAMLIFSSNYPQPSFSSTAIINAQEGSFYDYTIAASDSYANQLVFSADNLPAWLSLTDNGNNTAMLSGTPSSSDIGTHSVNIKVTNQYSPDVEQSFDVVVSPITSVQGLESERIDLQLYPNPANESIRVSCNNCIEGMYQISIANVLGQDVLNNSQEMTRGQIQLPVSSMPTGVYFIKLRNEHQQYGIKSFVKR